MNVEELKEQAEHAHESGSKRIGLTMAIVAVLLATTTMLSHRAHTEEVVLKGDANDQWSYYQAKNIRAHMYAADAKIVALLPEGKELAQEFAEMAKQEKEGLPAKGSAPAKDGAEKIQDRARERDKETHLTGLKANYFDAAELFLEISIVLCSIALLAEMKAIWRVSFITTAIGILVAARGLLLY
ncbi:MAG TPA: DUF4337 domain-containing protein [Alphaproteobacteria bacterium]|nr:DUF4337 domain-containing protein [Alphaproteobacteria bacterium]